MPRRCSTQQRRTFSHEFKRETVRLFEPGDMPAANVVRELGIKRNQQYR